MKNKCVFLVTSCDKYEDAWKPFFALLHIMWPNCHFPIYLNTETKSFNSMDCEVTPLHPQSLTDRSGKEISWSRRLREALEKIDSDYVLCFLEDFFLMSPVRSEIVDECIQWMDSDSQIGLIDFFQEPCLDGQDVGEFAPVNPKYRYCINAMSVLWRKSFLLNILRDDESPWDFEINGTYRWRRTDVKIYTHRKKYQPVFDFPNVPKYGYGIFQGKWLWKNKELFEKYGIEVDFSKRATLRQEDLPPLEVRKRSRYWILLIFLKVFRNPRLMLHYFNCLFDVVKFKLHLFSARFFHR